MLFNGRINNNGPISPGRLSINNWRGEKASGEHKIHSGQEQEISVNFPVAFRLDSFFPTVLPEPQSKTTNPGAGGIDVLFQVVFPPGSAAGM